jgi:transcriptional regulator GlxA family with amidase domain
VVPFDLSVPIEVFARARLPDGLHPYRVWVCGPAPDVDAGTFMLRAPWGLDALLDADTVVIPGCSEKAGPAPESALAALRAAAARGARLASICSGAFILAQTGLLDGLPATTHWAATSALAQAFPSVQVRPDMLYVDNGQILTSAGAAAGLDLCLHMIRRDFGSAVAADAARLSVMPLEREGGQAQFVVHQQPPVPAGTHLEQALAWIEDHLGEDLTLAGMAAAAGMSERTFGRRFRDQLGTTPIQWLLRARIRRAQHLLENTDHTVDRIAGQTGFGSVTAFRERFKQVASVSPRAYRAAFRGGMRGPVEPKLAPAKADDRNLLL